MKRKDYISWDNYFMAIAQISAQRSKDPNTQVGACIVDSKNRVVGIGYNGFPRGCSDDELPWEPNDSFLNSKYTFIIHSERNAILNSFAPLGLEGATMYVTLFPCNDCAKEIIQVGIKKIFYVDDKYHDEEFSIAARRMFNMAKVEYHQMKRSGKDIKIDLYESG